MEWDRWDDKDDKKVSDQFIEHNFEGIYGDEAGFRIVSVDKGKHLNFVVTSKRFGPNGVSMAPAEIKAVRDVLNELYPPEPEKFPYEVTGTTVYKKQIQTEPETLRVATAFTEQDAKRIAQALNEAEGL